MEIKEYKSIKVEELKKLYEEVGWKAYINDMSSLIAGFQKSLLILAAYEMGELIGLIRVVGDGHTIIYIQDLLVSEKKQHQGIGSSLLQEVIKRYQDVRQIVLVTDAKEETIAFYHTNGFQELNQIGCCGFMRLQKKGM